MNCNPQQPKRSNMHRIGCSQYQSHCQLVATLAIAMQQDAVIASSMAGMLFDLISRDITRNRIAHLATTDCFCSPAVPILASNR